MVAPIIIVETIVPHILFASSWMVALHVLYTFYRAHVEIVHGDKFAVAQAHSTSPRSPASPKSKLTIGSNSNSTLSTSLNKFSNMTIRWKTPGSQSKEYSKRILIHSSLTQLFFAICMIFCISHSWHYYIGVHHRYYIVLKRNKAVN